MVLPTVQGQAGGLKEDRDLETAHCVGGAPQEVVWCGVVWCGVVWCGVVWCGVVWCGVEWCDVVVWCGVVHRVWCGVVWRFGSCLDGRVNVIRVGAP